MSGKSNLHSRSIVVFTLIIYRCPIVKGAFFYYANALHLTDTFD